MTFTKMKFSIGVTLLLYILFPIPTLAHELDVAGWIPYWRDSQGIKDVKRHISSIDSVYPFVYTVKLDGSLNDNANLEAKEWRGFTTALKKKDIEVIPTVMWSNGDVIHSILSNSTKRTAHVASIVTMVTEGKFDGVDIDYEGKKSETIDYFSRFLKELKTALGEKILVCTIEPRTPPESLYKVVPEVIHYANDYDEIGKYCDRIQLMTYDQQRADITLNTEKTGAPYIPLSDVDWVRKVVEFALKSFPKEKLMLGIPSYGHHYAVTVAPNWYKGYTKIGALNVPDMLDVAREHKVTPSRNSAGEMSFTYLPKSSKIKLPSSLKIPKDTPKGNIVAARALAYANKTGKEVVVNVGWYSDAEAMKDKIELAKEFGLRGVALFKFDGEEDQRVWQYLK